MGAPLTPVPPFGTVGQMSAYLRVEISPTDLIANLALGAATVAIQNYTDQVLVYVSETVTLDGSGNDTILLPELPVIDVTAVVTNSDTSQPVTLNGPSFGSTADYGWTGGFDGLLIHRRGASIHWGGMFDATYGNWPDRRQSVQVTYSHGWQTIPTDLQLLCAIIASRAFAQDGATAETVGTYIAQYASQPGMIAPLEKSILDRYKPGRVR
jgi:hypothetical protein